MRGRYIAAFGFAWIIPQAAAPLLAGWIMDNVGPAWVWYVSGVLGVAAAAGFYALHLRGSERLNGVMAVSAEGSSPQPAPAG
jgi:MFS family permease